jgi:hypothetical protein
MTAIQSAVAAPLCRRSPHRREKLSETSPRQSASAVPQPVAGLKHENLATVSEWREIIATIGCQKYRTDAAFG